MQRLPGSAPCRQRGWHGNCSLESRISPYRSCSQDEREEFYPLSRRPDWGQTDGNEHL